jgi:hypothetical protein
MGDFLLLAVFKNDKSRPNFRPLFSKVQIMHYFWQKMGWATFWAIFYKLIWSP